MAGGRQWGDQELNFPFFLIFGCEHHLPPLFSPSSFLFLLILFSAPLLIPTLLSQLPPWGLSSPSPSPPPSLPTSPGRCCEPPGCCAAGGCLAGSLRRRPRHLRRCWGSGEERWSPTTVRSEPSRCPTPRGRSSRTRGGTSTRTARTWGCLCS